MTNYKINLTYEQALAIAESLVADTPDYISRPAYFDGDGDPECLASWVLHVAGFNPPRSWWNEVHRWPDGEKATSGTLRKLSSIRVLTWEIFENTDPHRDALLTRLQVGNDFHVDKRWVMVLGRAKSYVNRAA